MQLDGLIRCASAKQHAKLAGHQGLLLRATQSVALALIAFQSLAKALASCGFDVA